MNLAARASRRQPAFMERGDRQLVGLVLVVKLLVLLYGALTYETLSNQPIDSGRGLLEIWNRWDAPHYIDIAQQGYTSRGDNAVFIAFFPLYPWLIRATSTVLVDPLLAAFVVSGIASIAAGLLLWRVARLDLGDPLAKRAVLFLFIFPTSYFLHVGYTESLFIALVLGAFLAARQERWMVAGIVGGLAALTRVNGLVLVPALAAEAGIQLWRTGRWRWEWLWIGAVGAGFAVYLGVNWVVFGDPLAFLTVQREHWFKSLSPPWVGISETVEGIFYRDPSDAQLLGVQETIFIGGGLVATISSIFLLRPSYAVWMGVNWLLFTSTSFVFSVPRFSITLFPVFLLLAMASRRQTAYVAIVLWSLLFLALFIGQFVQGRWAF